MFSFFRKLFGTKKNVEESKEMVDVKEKIGELSDFVKKKLSTVDDIGNYISKKLSEILKHSNQLSKKEFEEIQESLKSISEVIDTIITKKTFQDKLDEISKQIEKSKIDPLKIIKPIEEQINRIENEVKKSKIDVTTIITPIRELNDELREELDDLSKEIKSIKNSSTAMNKNIDDLKTLIKESSQKDDRAKSIDNTESIAVSEIIKLSDLGVDVIKNLTEAAIYFGIHKEVLESDWNFKDEIKKLEDENSSLKKEIELLKREPLNQENSNQQDLSQGVGEKNEQ